MMSKESLFPLLRSRIFIAVWTLTALLSLAGGVELTLRPLYLREPFIGLSYQQIGWLGALSSGIGLVAPLVCGTLADQTGQRKIWILIGLPLVAVASVAYLTIRSFGSAVPIYVLDGVSTAVVGINLQALATLALREGGRGRQMGIYATADGIGYALASFLLVPLVGTDPTYRAVFFTSAAISLSCFFVALVGVKDISPLTDKANVSTVKEVWKGVLFQRNLLVLYLFWLLYEITGSMCFEFFSIYLNEGHGIPNRWIGAIHGVQMVVRMPLAIYLGGASDRWGRKPLLVFTILMGGIRWTLIGLAPNLGWIVGAQILWGFGFAAYTIGTTLMTDLVAPEYRGSALGMMSLVSGIGTLVGPPIGGYIAERIALPMVFQVGGFLSCLAGALVFALLRPVHSDQGHPTLPSPLTQPEE